MVVKYRLHGRNVESFTYAMPSLFSGEDVDDLRSKIQRPSGANIRRNMLITAEGRHEQIDASETAENVFNLLFS